MSMYGPKKLTVDTGPGLTKQAFADEADINKIVASFERTGMLQSLNKGQPFYGDVSELSDYQEALNVVKQAEELFYGMDARVRERFANDPARMIAFLEDEENYEEALKLGMVQKRPEEKRRRDDRSEDRVIEPEEGLSESKPVSSKKVSKPVE